MNVEEGHERSAGTGGGVIELIPSLRLPILQIVRSQKKNGHDHHRADNRNDALSFYCKPNKRDLKLVH